jgi:hypothetical protein
MRRTGDVLHRPFQGTPAHNLFHTAKDADDASTAPRLGTLGILGILGIAHKSAPAGSRRAGEHAWEQQAQSRRRSRIQVRRIARPSFGQRVIDTSVGHVTLPSETRLERDTSTKPRDARHAHV